LIEKVEVLEEKENRARHDHAHDKQCFFCSRRLAVFDPDSSGIIDDYGREQNEDVGRDKGHIKETTCRQKQCPSGSMRQHEIQCRYNRKKDEELDRIKKHGYVVSKMFDRF
jgi:hypothetical protein